MSTVQQAQEGERAPSAPPGRNGACSCGSGKKYKRCCLSREGQAGSFLMQPRVEDSQPAGLVFDDRAAARTQTNAGVTLKRSGKLNEAIACFRQAAQLDPAQYAAHFQLGSLLAQTGSFEEAARSLIMAIQLRPDAPEAINNLGAVFRGIGSHERAVVCFRKALDLQPNHAPALSNLGSSLAALGRHTEAIAALQRATRHDPSLADAYVNLGSALVSAGRCTEAIEACLRALELSPGDPEALLNLGNGYKERGQLALAEATYLRAIAAAPGDARAHINLGDAYRDHGKISEAADSYRNALCAEPHSTTAYSNMLYLHAFAHDLPQDAELKRARRWETIALPEGERAAARQAESSSAGVFQSVPLAGRKLRVGIVSAELGSHAVAEFLQPLLESLDRERFHLTLFPSAHRADAREARSLHLLSLADACLPVWSMSDADAVALIRRERIDVLMDTSGHTAGNRLGIFARRAAPVQCTYIGYWGTTGLTEMDWFVSDPDAPAACEAGFSERLWRLPRIAVCYRGDVSLRNAPSDELEREPAGTVWVGSFNKYAKIREETLELWANVLHAVPEAKLLLEDRGTHEEDAHERILGGLAAHGIAPERVEFIPCVAGHERHMLLYNRLDVALDTLPFNSGTTAFDALWMGVPLVALEGDWIGGRMSASTLRALGRAEWIAKTHQEYAGIVRGLVNGLMNELARGSAGGGTRPSELRTRLREQQRTAMSASPLTDAAGLAKALGEAFTGMYEHWRTR